jgi:prepilin-type N-terminal cleavage/methylation domain-containing protein
MNRKIRTKEQGFTLIEIIAVLIILGILAAVAVPKYLDMQVEAQKKAKEGACAAAASQITMAFSKAMLVKNGSVSDAFANATDDWENIDLGDFTLISVDGSVSDETLDVELDLPDSYDSTIDTNCTISNPAYTG